MPFFKKDGLDRVDRPRIKGGRVLAAALMANVAAAELPGSYAFAQTEPVAPRTISWNRVGTAPFATSIEQALDAQHRGWIFNAALSENTLAEADRPAFEAAALAALAAVGSMRQETVQPGARTPWMTFDGGRIMGARNHARGDAVISVDTRHPINGRTFDVRRTDGVVVTFLIVTEVNPVDGTACFNVIPVRETRPTPAPAVEELYTPPAVERVVDVCPDNPDFPRTLGVQTVMPRGYKIARSGEDAGQCVRDDTVRNALIIGGVLIGGYLLTRDDDGGGDGRHHGERDYRDPGNNPSVPFDPTVDPWN